MFCNAIVLYMREQRFFYFSFVCVFVCCCVCQNCTKMMCGAVRAVNVVSNTRFQYRISIVKLVIIMRVFRFLISLALCLAAHAFLQGKLKRYKSLPIKTERSELSALTIDWAQTNDSEDGVMFVHDEVEFRVGKNGESMYIPQAERYTSSDWIHNLQTIPTSRLLHRIKGIVAVNGLWSSLIAIIFQFKRFNSPGSRCHSLLGSALGLLLVFRTNTAYNRFWEGRRIWEKVLTTMRNMARYAVSYSDITGKERLSRILHLICAFPIILQEHLQGHEVTHVDLKTLLLPEDIEKLSRVSNRPLYILGKLSREIRLIPESLPAFTARERQLLMVYVDSLTSAVGGAERLVKNSSLIHFIWFNILINDLIFC